MFTHVTQLLRGLLRRPLFNSLLFLLLTLGSTAFGTVFVLVAATALRPLPFRDADRLYSISSLEPAGNNRTTQFASSAIQISRWRETATAYDRIEAYTPTNPKLTGDGEPESLRGALVTSGLFDLMGAVPALGRAFLAEEETPGSDVVILSDGYWRRRLGADSGIIGRRILIDDMPRTVVGVMRPAFTLFFLESDVFMPYALAPQLAASPTYRVMTVVAHLREGATPEQAESQVRTANQQLGVDYPRAYRSTQGRIVPLRTQLLGQQRSTVMLLLGAVALMFLIACANALNLTFADSIARRTSTLTRLVLGASRPSIVRRRLAETVVIGVAAGIAAVTLGQLTLVLLKSVNPGAFTGMGTVEFWTTGLITTLAVCVVAACVIAIPVAAVEARGNVAEMAGTMTKSVGNRADRRRRSALLAIQVMVTLMLVCGTTLLLRNVRSLLAVSPGFKPDNVLVAAMTISARTYPTPPDRANHVARILEAVRALPGVHSASTIQSRFVLAETMNAPFDVQEVPDPNGQSPLANIRHTTPDLIETLGMRLLQGRAIDDTDRMDGPPVVVINESFAKAYLPGVDPIGKHMRRASPPPGPWMEIVGVVEDVMDAGLGFPVGPAFYVSYLQQNTPTARVVLLVRAKA
jgi:putative ABC transport system permease protein